MAWKGRKIDIVPNGSNIATLRLRSGNKFFVNYVTGAIWDVDHPKYYENLAVYNIISATSCCTDITELLFDSMEFSTVSIETVFLVEWIDED